MAFRLTSSAFENDDDIPVEFTADRDDISPPLSWFDPPPKTMSFALVLEDRDAKEKKIHWLLWNLPATARSLPEKVATVPVLPDGSHQGRNDFQKVGYSGPRLARVTEHKYEFTLYALDTKLALTAGSTHAELTVLMHGHTLAKTLLVGRFKPERDDARLRSLEDDKEYVLQSDDIKQRLEQAYNARPTEVTAFFRRFSLPSAFAVRKIREHLKTIADDAVRRTLEDYITFANRFRIQLRLKTSPLRFKTLLQPSSGTKFHVRIVGDHLGPGEPDPGVDIDSYSELFPAPNLKILDEAQALVNKGEATFTQIDDAGPQYLVLKDLEIFAYKDDGVAFFIHNAEQPYLGCIFGEKMSKQQLAALGPTVTEFQKKYFSRTAGGRPPDMNRLKKMLEIDKKPISNQEKAFELAQGGDQKKVETLEVKLSKHHGDKRKKRRR
jgi:Raf kinase inhibitor-like YbhB/YbcL family protein